MVRYDEQATRHSLVPFFCKLLHHLTSSSFDSSSDHRSKTFAVIDPRAAKIWNLYHSCFEILRKPDHNVFEFRGIRDDDAQMWLAALRSKHVSFADRLRLSVTTDSPPSPTLPKVQDFSFPSPATEEIDDKDIEEMRQVAILFVGKGAEEIATHGRKLLLGGLRTPAPRPSPLFQMTPLDSIALRVGGKTFPGHCNVGSCQAFSLQRLSGAGEAFKCPETWYTFLKIFVSVAPFMLLLFRVVSLERRGKGGTGGCREPSGV